MRRRIVVVNGILVFFSIMFLFVLSMLVINYSSKEQSYIQIKEYNSMVCEYFDGENFDDTINYFQKYNLRLTIFDENFELIVDTGILNDLGDVRPELNDLGNIYTRYSTNLDQDMLYLANYDDGYFIRVSIEVSKINTLLYQYITIGILFLFIILLISIVLSLYLLKKTMLPINNVVNQLGSICGSSNLSIDNEASITKEINKIKFQIEEKFNDIQTEKLKLEGILEASNEGIIVIDISNNIQIINTRALAIFNLNNNVLNNSYYSLLKSKELTENIKTSLENKCNNNGITFIDNFVYNISIIYVNNAFIEGLLVTLGDITTDYNLAKVKKDFFQNASHELKSPLTSILGYQQLIKEGIYETKEDIIDGVTCTIKEANKMNKLIIDMLELSQLESEYKEEVSNINIKLIVEEVIKSFKLLIKEKNIKLILNIDDCFKNINNKHAFELIKNLVENGIKYNNSNSNLEITLTNDNFIIKDYGKGIDCKNKERIFERFYRISSNNQIPGNGLGLAIVKHITNIYNYDIEIDSVLSKYTEFKITF